MIASSKSADDRAKSQIADVKSDFAARQSAIAQNFIRAKKDLYTLQVERDRLTAQVSDLAVERDRLVLDLAGRDTDRDRLKREMTEPKADQAIREPALQQSA